MPFKRNYFATAFHAVLFIVRLKEVYGCVALIATLLGTPLGGFMRAVVDISDAGILNPNDTGYLDNYAYIGILAMGYITTLFMLYYHMCVLRKPNYLMTNNRPLKVLHMMPAVCSQIWTWFVMLICWVDDGHRLEKRVEMLCVVESITLVITAWEGNGPKGCYRQGVFHPFSEVPPATAAPKPVKCTRAAVPLYSAFGAGAFPTAPPPTSQPNQKPGNYAHPSFYSNPNPNSASQAEWGQASPINMSVAPPRYQPVSALPLYPMPYEQLSNFKSPVDPFKGDASLNSNMMSVRFGR